MTSQRATRAAGRPRQQRAQNTEHLEASLDALSQIKDALPQIVKVMIEDAQKGNPSARKLVIEMAADELRRARATGAMEILRQLAATRNAGSPILKATWAQLYEKNAAWAGNI